MALKSEDAEESSSNPSGSVYDAEYYARYCGDRAYDGDELHWRRFFGKIADRIVNEIGPATVLDAGCAKGFLVEALRERGVDAEGIDVSSHAIRSAAREVRPHLRVGSISEPFPRRYDLITCIEVLEHMTPEASKGAVANLCAHTDQVLFSSTPDDYRELTHQNILPPEAWAERFASHGFLIDLEYDATFIAGWATRFRRRREPLQRVVRDYERSRSRLARENYELRQVNLEQRGELSRLRVLLAEARTRGAGLRQQLDQVGDSASWRVTAPLRAARAGLATYPMARKAWRSIRASGVGAWLRYRAWIREHDTLSADLRARISERIEAGPVDWPLISVLMPVHDPSPEQLSQSIDSVRSQLYPHWELCIADDASTDARVERVIREAARQDHRIRVVFREANGHISAATNSALELARGEFVAFLDHDDCLAPHALFCMAKAIRSDEGVSLVYSDEDKLDRWGQRCEPHFKPEWNPDLLRSYNYVCHLTAIRAALVRRVGGLREGFEGAQDYDLVLRCSEELHPAQIRHVPLVLYHWRKARGSMAGDAGAKPYAMDAAVRAVQEHLDRRGVAGEVSESRQQPGTLRVRYGLAKPPKVSLIVLTRDRHDLLRVCVESVLALTAYEPYELIIVDNGSEDETTLDYLASLESRGVARVLRDPGPFNFSALNNRAMEQADGEVLVLLNNDTEVLHADWLTELVSHVVRPEIGAVGCKLWYPDGRLQHAGVILGVGGVAGHACQRALPEEAGYMARTRVIQDMSAVTAACLAVRKDVYREVGGLDEDCLAVAFGDVDFCLKALQSGYRNLYTPFAELRHHESASRGLDEGGANQARFARETDCMRTRWSALLANDPAYSPNLTLLGNDFALADPPRSTVAQLVSA